MNNKKLLDRYSIAGLTTADKDYIFANSKLRNGYPVFYPQKNKDSKRTIISFVDAFICDKNKKRIDDELANFDLLEQDVFDPKDPLANTKIKFIKALLSVNYRVQGGVYYKGNYYTNKMTVPKAKFLLKSFINNYFYIEDSDTLKAQFFEKGDEIPFWPTKSHNDSKILMFSAVDATISKKVDKKSEERVGGPYNFDIYAGETLDFDDANDKVRIEVIRSLLDKERIVRGFYYKGALLDERLSEDFKEYLEKNFIKKNFVVEQRPRLLDYVQKNPTSGYPIFWPCFDKARRPLIVSVLNASASWISEEKYKNFNVYDDEDFDLKKLEYQVKLKIIRSLFYKDNSISGALYFDGLLVNFDAFDRNNIEHRKAKVEKALKIYVTNSEDFININRHYTTANREQLIRLSPYYDEYYPNNIDEVPNFLAKYDAKVDPLLKIIDANYIDEKGNFVLKENINFELREGEKIANLEVVDLLYAIYDKTKKARGGIYYKGTRITNNNNKAAQAFLAIMPDIIPGYDSSFLRNAIPAEYHLSFDRYSNLPLYWPTNDASGRRVLLSVVDADIHFKVGRSVVKAVNNATFDIYEGETFGLVGESGSGKTTISRAILGINKLTKGAIYYDGKLISSKLTKEESHKTKKNIQMIFQDPAASLNERANVDYIISEGIYNFKMFKTKEERLAKITSLLNSVGLLPEHLSRYPHEFSGGQRQRIGIARALAIEPSLVLADEPISALDVSIRAQVLNLLKKLQKEKGLTYLFIAHDLSIIRYISDRIAVMHNGYIVELGIAEEIYTHPLHPYTRSLITAIPQPDPKTKTQRKKLRYEQGDLDYGQCAWKEMRPGHFVLVNDKLEEEIKERIKSIK